MELLSLFIQWRNGDLEAMEPWRWVCQGVRALASYLSPLHVHDGVDKHGDKRRNPRCHWPGRGRLENRQLCPPSGRWEV